VSTKQIAKTLLVLALMQDYTLPQLLKCDFSASHYSNENSLQCKHFKLKHYPIHSIIKNCQN